MKTFPISLRLFLDINIDKTKKDIFGNFFKGLDRYEFIEMSVSYNYKIINSIRFLGKSRGKSIRFLVNNILNIFDPTTLNIVSHIKFLADQTDDFFSKISTLFSCRPGSFQEDKLIIDDLTFLGSGAKGSDITSNIGWFEFVNDYFVPKPIILEQKALTKEQLEALDKKYAGKLFKTEQLIDSESNDFLGLKSSLARLAASSFEINNSR